MTQLKDRVAVITGSGQGIGRGIALEFVERGATVVINDVNAEHAQNVVEEITAAGGQAMSKVADVSTEEGASELIKATVDAYGKIDILVNNAGITRDNLIIKMTPDEFDKVMTINLRSAWLCSKAAVRAMMRKRYGRIINMASVSGIMGQAGQTNYSASKAGLIGFTKSLAREVGGRSITVNAVAPGFVLTDLTKDLPEELVKGMMDFIPLGKWAEIQDIANAAAFLASDEAALITGHVLNVDGGMAM
jgi:3-oxoacyl-[acyl-carrier protein] reductase